MKKSHVRPLRETPHGGRRRVGQGRACGADGPAGGAGRGPGAQRKPNAESPREVTRKRREGAARARRGRARPPGHTGRQGGTPRVRACATRVHARPRGGAGQGRARGTTARACTREKVDLEPKTRHEQLPKITQTRFARSLTRPFTDHEASRTATRSRPARPHGAAGAAGPERSRSAGSRVHISFLNKTDIRLFCSSEANVTKTEFKL